ncbi:polyamine ABC transporter substrate-binding protein [Nodosilinea sp. FACHB-141]|uniref:polyamine ABC transporter substrate-binding protein n=1 Tax=Cyanophyceae TaxID=3028117 RepID=UPI00168915C3|nr:spermidine/putrescine ABC transporter substrate-binding protein [Nodosilinea sp. FACHB-13]MBD2111566.1 spermidine/putrescine ABC transporter substrate-binding protein [Nodosilinea sp. FACHB-141]
MPVPGTRLQTPSFSRLSAVSRRRFLQGSAAVMASLAATNCRQNLAGPPAGGGANDGTLHIYTWANYTDDGLAQAFTERTGIPVVVDIYDSNEVMLTRLQAGGGDAYSIIYPSDYMVSEMLELDLLTELDQSRLTGLENLRAQWSNPAYDPNNAHSVPFCWGTTGLLYNREASPGEPTDWDFLWDNQAKLSRRITMLDDMRETLGATLKSLGYSYNSNNLAEIEAAYNRLLELRPHIAAFKTTGFENELLSGDLSVSMAYSSDAIALTLEDDRMQYIIPASGASLWTDTLAIPATAPNVDAAYQWINFLLEPEVASAAVERLFFATANQAAFDLLPAEIQNNADLYPSDEILAKSEGIVAVNTASTDLFDQFWTEVTSA